MDAVNVDYTDIEQVRALCQRINEMMRADIPCVVVKHPARPNYNVTHASRADPALVV